MPEYARLDAGRLEASARKHLAPDLSSEKIGGDAVKRTKLLSTSPAPSFLRIRSADPSFNVLERCARLPRAGRIPADAWNFGLCATIPREPRQARKGATVTGQSRVPQTTRSSYSSPGRRSFLQMSYQVIARKWRPKKFSDIVGQRHVTQTLENAIKTG